MDPIAPERRETKHTLRGDEVTRERAEEDELGQFIPLHYHGQMLADARRMGAFQEAIEKLVPINAHVVELGGGTGVQSFFAAKRARKVTCVERLPHVADTARRLLAHNGVGDKVTVVQADARSYVPDEPVDVVICEMLHTGLLREKQTEVLTAFKDHHEARFGRAIPLIIPEASVLAAQPIYQPYEFSGFHAPVPLFEVASPGACATPMGEPETYSIIEYVREIPRDFTVSGFVRADRDGTINALRLITKNVVGIFNDENRSADWLMHFLSVPLPESFQVKAGDRIGLQFHYEAGGSIESLMASLRAERLQTT